MNGDLLVYGSYGYTGSLIVDAAVEDGESPVIAGRNARKVESQATEYDLDHRTFSLDHPSIVAEEIAGFDAVLNCAGPFTATADPLIDACLETDTDYLDITGRIDVIESVADRDEPATEAGVTLLPAVGFDVVPTDCLAVYLADQVDDPTKLRLALDGFETFSRGTAKSMIEALDNPGAVRENGELREVPTAWKTREFAFDGRTKRAVTIPWGDVSTAYHSTGVPNVETYATVPEAAIPVMKQMGSITPLFGMWPVQTALKAAVDAFVTGPSERARERGTVTIVGEIESESGERAAARLRTPEAYALTAETALESARRVVEGHVAAGFHTPGAAFGPDFVLQFEGVERTDITPSRGPDY